MFEYLLFLSSGLFLGWSLGANDSANIFGTAVGTKMLRFTTAAIIASIFIVLGAVISGQNTTDTLNALGGVNTLPAAFAVSLSAGLGREFKSDMEVFVKDILKDIKATFKNEDFDV